ncbi:MAG TPA: hypothetical protein VLY04_04760, partial [Bryobacteraceae bacterium]|nr:hypothetical protein [Bryobacteraceae bacterium]
MALSSGTAAANGTVALNLSLTSPSGSEPAAVQWTLTYPASSVTAISAVVGSVASGAGKTVTCFGGSGSYTCIAAGMNASIIPNGTLAVVNLTMAVGATSTPIGVTNTLGALPDGTAVSISATGGTVTGGALPIQVSTLACNPLSLGPSASSTCTVTLNQAAPAGGSTVTLTNTNTTLTVPASVTVPAAATTATFNATTAAIASSQSATVTATLGTGSQSVT